MKDCQQEVLEEKTALDEKVKKLRNFLETKQSFLISQEEQILLMKQVSAMAEYSKILNERIKLFTQKQKV